MPRCHAAMQPNYHTNILPYFHPSKPANWPPCQPATHRLAILSFSRPVLLQPCQPPPPPPSIWHPTTVLPPCSLPSCKSANLEPCHGCHKAVPYVLPRESYVLLPYPPDTCQSVISKSPSFSLLTFRSASLPNSPSAKLPVFFYF